MEFSVLQWNVWYREDLEKVVDFLRQHPADVVCLQELTIDDPKQGRKHGPRYIAEQLGYQAHFQEFPIEPIDGPKETWANGLFSRFPIAQRSRTWINKSDGDGGYSNEFRAYIEVELEVGKGRTLTAGTTHMSYTDRFVELPSKKAETDRLMQALKPRTERHIFTGDLNALPGSYTIRQLEKRLKSAGPNNDQKTWTTKPFSYRGFEARTLDWRLDYVFATPDLEVVSAEIIDTELSDHLPVLVRFRTL
jgi:endonuclease/exonuclease/phosphatase family metal-dependent hydrolase